MKHPLSCSLLFIVLMMGSPAPASELTPENLEAIRSKLKTIRENLTNHQTSRNSNAGEIFAKAAVDPRAAVELYLNCEKLVNYEREGRPETDFRGWKDDQSDRMREPEFIESLQLQLRYLALSCQAANAENIDSVFPSLLSYVDGLSYMEELPTGSLTQSVAGSVFSKAYYLENLLGENSGWESVPFNIGGIYDNTILPHLREKQPDALMNAWDKRIEQQSRIVAMTEKHKEEEMRGKDREEQRRARNNQNNQKGVMKELDKDDYLSRTLPRLKWAKLKDMFLYVDEVTGAKSMLDYVEQHLTHELGEEFFNEFNDLINNAGVGSHRLSEDTGTSN